MEKEIFNQTNIFFDNESQTQDEAFQSIAKFVSYNGYSTSENDFYEGLKNREKESTTGFKDGIAIPHSNDDSVVKPGLFLVKFSNAIEWDSLDKKPITVAFVLSIPKNGSTEHLKLLSKIARKLMDENFRQTILENEDKVVLATTVDEI
ncbi:PTS sugar transporter subunit IIA [Companilactobacillus nantensis]|uniref:PTS system protein n=1 Tax=Companilactobacillus nantensis DSM 16982 TaxID=1423774 RepID=A0A0R1WLT4_9LACO|nr:fructose PTS transporter subunit IIA [Companilactobacillus nantensis]KRM18625.1 PTS system protein [Companilactobacillus nantensis DSM 16982]GEO63189.1 PTS fructose transporter subunit IIA [Companilactobacillus nantensis]